MLYILFMCNCSTMCAVTGMVLAVDAVLKECDIQLLVVLYSSVCVRACVCPCMCACVRLLQPAFWCLSSFGVYSSTVPETSHPFRLAMVSEHVKWVACRQSSVHNSIGCSV